MPGSRAVIGLVALLLLVDRADAAAQPRIDRTVPPPPRQSGNVAAGPDIMGALVDSLKLLGIEHGVRIGFQEKTRRALEGPFWADYVHSVRRPAQWDDSDNWLVNYVGHPLHGAAAGYIWIDHDPRSQREEFGLSAAYWATRWRSIAWSAGYSLQFEIGPLSEASIGNVGLDPKTTGWVDYVVTPIGGFAILVAEDALDRYVVKWVEARTKNRFYRASLRLIFNPSRTFANLSMGKHPWYRDTRQLSW